jgi:histidine triad (HIT) family protein
MTGVIKQLIDSRTGLLYEGKNVVAMVAAAPAIEGHVWVLPKQEVPILEQLPDFVVAEMFVVADRIAMALFESLGCQGTTILLENGVAAGQSVPHPILHVIPRAENDGLPLDWERKQLDEETMSTVELKLKAETKNVGVFEKEKPKPVEIAPPEEVKSDESNLELEHLRRIP